MESSYLPCFEIRVDNFNSGGMCRNRQFNSIKSIHHAMSTSTRKKEEAKTREEYEYVAPESYLPAYAY